MQKIFLICFLILTTYSNAQKKSDRAFFKVSKSIKAQKLNEVQIAKSIQPKTKPTCLTYKCNSNSKVSFCNNDSDENYVEFQELGYLEKTEIIVINKFNYNEEFYILLNKKDCKSLVLDGFPLRIENSNFFIVYNNPSTDQRKKIQILKMENGKMNLYDEIQFPEKMKLQKFLRLDQNEIYIIGQNNQIWKTTIKS